MKAKKERPFGTTSGAERLMYAVGDLGSNFVWTFCSSFLTLYYTDSVLISAGLIGTIMLICRIFDGFSDIAAGVLIEKTQTKRGKARPWFGGTIIPLVIMSAYNKLNGKPSAQNDWLLTDILRKEWGFEGFVVSDWGAAYDQVQSVAAGTDLTMPGPRGIQCIVDAVENGSLPIEKLDVAVRNVLKIVVQSTAKTKAYTNMH